MSKASRHRQFQRLNKRLGKMIRGGKENRIVINVVPFPQAMLDWRLGEGATRFLLQAFQTAEGLTDDRLTCFCCCKEWDEHRAPIGCLTVEFLNLPEEKTGDAALLSGICRQCMMKGMPEIMRAVERDFPHTSRQFLSQEGNA